METGNPEMKQILSKSIAWRENFQLNRETEALRIFYGPGESEHPELSKIAIDLFGNHAWITQWSKIKDSAQEEIRQYLLNEKVFGRPIQSAVWIDRSSDKIDDAKPFLGEPPREKFEVREFGIPYLVQMLETKHPGLFLDHAPLRQWLLATQNGKNVLNLFAYTGSLSIAAGRGGATNVVTLDLSKPTIQWARESWVNAGLPDQEQNFIFGDALEWLPRLAKKATQENKLFDTILCDPPSFSRSKTGTFSTQKDSTRLHQLIFPLLKKGGILVTSINSENILERDFLRDIAIAAEKTDSKIRILKRIDLPETFPTDTRQLSTRYLKGFYLLKE